MITWGVERHKRGVKPPTPDKSSTGYFMIHGTSGRLTLGCSADLMSNL